MCEATHPLIVLPLPHLSTDFHLLPLQEYLSHLIPCLRHHANPGGIPTRGRSQGVSITLCAHPVPSASSVRSHVNPALTADFPVLQLPVLYVVRSSLFPTHATHSSDRLATPFFRQIVVYAVVIFAVWNIPAVRNVINPLKLFTIGWHELCHIIAVSDINPSVCCRDTPFLNTFVTLVGHPDWWNDSTRFYRPEYRWMYQSRRRLATSHSLCRLHRVHLPWRNFRLSRLRHSCFKNNELGPWLRDVRPVSPRQRQAVGPSVFSASNFSTFPIQYDNINDLL